MPLLPGKSPKNGGQNLWPVTFLQAMGMMLPTPGRGDVASRMAGADPTLEGKMACMSLGSYLDCAHNTLQLDGVLDSLKVGLQSL